MSIKQLLKLAIVLQTTARLNYMQFYKLCLQSSFPNTAAYSTSWAILSCVEVQQKYKTHIAHIFTDKGVYSAY